MRHYDYMEQDRYRYFVTMVSVGTAGLAARPAVIDRHGWGLNEPKTVKVFRVGEDHLADALATRLNREEA